MQAFGETAALRVMITEQLQGVHIIWIAAHETLDELNFRIEVALFRVSQLFLGAALGWHTMANFFQPRAASQASG